MSERLRAIARFLVAVEVWPVAFCAAASLISKWALLLGLGVTVCFWLARWLARGYFTLRTTGDWPIALLLLVIFATLWATALPAITREQAARLLIGIAFYYSLVNWATSFARLQLVRIVLIAVGLLLAFSAPVSVQWFTGVKLIFIPESLYGYLPQFLADPIHPNVMAGALVVLLPHALTLILFDWRKSRWYERVLAVVGSLFMLTMLILTKSRGAWIALVVCLTFLVALRWRYGWLAVPVTAVTGVLTAWLMNLTRVMNLLTAIQAIGGAQGRVELWAYAIDMIQDFPFTGIGLGAFRQVIRTAYSSFLINPGADISHAHNLFLQVAVDLGLPGLIAWLSLLLIVTFAAWQIFQQGRRSGDRWLAGLGAGLLSSQVALAVHGLTDAVTWGTRPALVVWAVWGLTMAVQNRLREGCSGHRTGGIGW